jgi:hypothetical protein
MTKFLLPAALTLAIASPAFAATDNFLLVNNAAGQPTQTTLPYNPAPTPQPNVPNTGGTSTPTPAPAPTPRVPNTGAGGNAAATAATLAGSIALAAIGVALSRRFSIR